MNVFIISEKIGWFFDGLVTLESVFDREMNCECIHHFLEFRIPDHPLDDHIVVPVIPGHDGDARMRYNSHRMSRLRWHNPRTSETQFLRLHSTSIGSGHEEVSRTRWTGWSAPFPGLRNPWRGYREVSWTWCLQGPRFFCCRRAPRRRHGGSLKRTCSAIISRWNLSGIPPGSPRTFCSGCGLLRGCQISPKLSLFGLETLPHCRGIKFARGGRKALGSEGFVGTPPTKVPHLQILVRQPSQVNCEGSPKMTLFATSSRLLKL